MHSHNDLANLSKWIIQIRFYTPCLHLLAEFNPSVRYIHFICPFIRRFRKTYTFVRPQVQSAPSVSPPSSYTGFNEKTWKVPNSILIMSSCKGTTKIWCPMHTLFVEIRIKILLNSKRKNQSHFRSE